MDNYELENLLLEVLSMEECSLVNKLIDKIIKEERERCAKLLDTFEIEGTDSYGRLCAEAIRNLE